MRTRRKHAPIVFAALTVLTAVACGLWFRSVETPPWRQDSSSAPAVAKAPAIPPEPAPADFTPFTFITYNVRNWLVSHQAPEKSAEAKAAIIKLLTGGEPDVVGLCEIGSKEDVAEIQAMLKAAGIDLPHAHYTGGADSVRHLALISRFPILSTKSPGLLFGMEEAMRRGILDATLDIGGRPVRFIGLHLKSKRTVPEYDQGEFRLAEARHARSYLDGILAGNPDAALIAYGDFNDTTRSLSTKAIYGIYRSPGYMSPVHVRDSRGDTWTHRYELQDSYTRIDFVTVSAGIRRHVKIDNVKKDKSRIIDDPLWEIASDHRPVLVRFE